MVKPRVYIAYTRNVTFFCLCFHFQFHKLRESVSCLLNIRIYNTVAKKKPLATLKSFSSFHCMQHSIKKIAKKATRVRWGKSCNFVIGFNVINESKAKNFPSASGKRKKLSCLLSSTEERN